MNYRICLFLLCNLLLIPTLLAAQSRDLRSERIVIDDNGTDGTMHTMTIRTPDSLPQNIVLTIPDPGSGTAQFLLSTSGSNGAWMLGGNTGTTPGTNFLGTTDSNALHFYVNSGTNNSLILNVNGSMQRDAGGDVRGINAVDLQIFRANNAEVASAEAATIGGGIRNTASGINATVGGGSTNTASGTSSTVGGGGSNTIAGHYSAIPGGHGLTLDTNAAGSFGFLGGNITGAQGMSINAPDVAVFGNVDMWLANNNNSASELRFYEPNPTAGSFPNGTNFTAFRAQIQTSDITYTLPATLPAVQNGTTGDLGGGALLTDATGALVWGEGAVLTANLNFLNTANAATDDQTVTVNGAMDGDIVSLGIPNAAQPAGIAWYQAWVSAANTITVRFFNLTGAAVDPDGAGGATFSIAVTRP